ncbi:4'-phosphopantetheinyl transferase family protein [Aquabacter spiritensis]|uniref:4'-phosphopantetheinyl transferase n=1 Tax=Aquabacter spiritensis TaxID=933073 RepID=A0A4R3LY81_9HYPH|nr:4'-phosphopantetheinyl transferase superfamily protein [Aquabacter spiritensis]TCT04769.1 4'-phosphopantetheinyl transferase [Aquabacter spiritensis]
MPPIDLYVTATAALAPDAEAGFAALLDQEERQRAARLPGGARRDFSVAHGLCRLALTRAHAAVAPAAWRFRIGRHGKPAPEAPADLHFSLTHAAGLVAVAVAWGREVGVDAEALVPALATVQTAEVFCTPVELAALCAGDAAARTETFFALWTLKESLIKATGEGLSRPPQTIACGLHPLRILGFDAPGTWRSWTAEIPAVGRLAVSAAAAGMLRVYRVATPSDLAGSGPPPLDAEFIEVPFARRGP